MDIHLKFLSCEQRISLSRTTIQYAVIALVVAISTAAGYWGSQEILIVLLAAVLGTAGLLVLLRHQNLAFILIYLGGMFVPFSGPGGFNAAMLAIILLIGLWVMEMFVVKRKFEFVNSRAIRPVFYFILISILAFGMGQIPWFTFANQAPLDAQVGGFAIYSFLLASMIATANLIQDIKWLKIIVWSFVCLGAFYVVGRMLILPYPDELYQGGFYENSMFWMWLVTLPLSQAIYNNHLTTRVRVILYVLVAMSFWVTMVQQGDWRSGWVPAAVVVAVLVGLRFRRLVLLSIPFLLVFIVYLAQDLIATDLYSWGTRLDAWMVVLDISRTSPILGLGFANYYWYAPLFSIRGYYIQFNSHSQFVDIIAQTGILGLICFFWLLFEVGRLAWKLMHGLPEGFAKGYAYGIFASVFGSIMAAFLVDWLLPFAYNIGLDGVRASILPWIFWGGMVSIEYMHQRK